LRYIQRNLIDDDWDVARFLHDYYDDLISGFEVDILQLEYDIGDMIAEVGTDPCEEEFGGWRNVVKRWTRGVDPYDRLKSNLLLFEGDDPDVCIEAHHIAIETGLPTELGTADGHFIDQHEKEPRCRKEDILSKTELDDVVDLRP